MAPVHESNSGVRCMGWLLCSWLKRESAKVTQDRVYNAHQHFEIGIDAIHRITKICPFPGTTDHHMLRHERPHLSLAPLLDHLWFDGIQIELWQGCIHVGIF